MTAGQLYTATMSMLGMFVTGLTKFFSAFNNGGEMTNNFSQSGVEMSVQHLNEARFEREQQQLKLEARIKALRAELVEEPIEQPKLKAAK